MRPSRVALGFLGAASVLAPGLSSGQAPVDPRLEMDAFASALDAAVRRVSRPSPVVLVGREGSRGYRLPGLGALFVLPPRVLPSPRSIAEHQAARSVDDAIRHLEQGLRTASSPEIRAQMEKNLRALRQTRAELRGTARDRATTLFGLPSPPTILAGEELEPGPPRLEELQRELESQMAEQMHALQEAEQSLGEQERQMARHMQAQLRELQARMEAVRRDVERARMEAERQVEMRLAEPPVAVAAPPAPEPPAPPAAPLAPRASAEPDAVAPAAPGPPVLAPAPWQMWFNIEEPADGRTGEAVIRDVKGAVTALLERQGAALHHLRPEEYVVVAVDFVPRLMTLGRPAQKTLVVKARKRDLDERRAGLLGPDELRSRIEYSEY